VGCNEGNAVGAAEGTLVGSFVGIDDGTEATMLEMPEKQKR
jgi:hypothetical protein